MNKSNNTTANVEENPDTISDSEIKEKAIEKNKMESKGEADVQNEVESNASKISDDLEYLDGEEEEEDTGIKTIKLRKPIIFDGNDITELTFDFDSISARDLMKAESEARTRLRKEKRQISFPKQADSMYTAIVAAKAANVKTELIHSLGGQDFETITTATTNFLLGGE